MGDAADYLGPTERSRIFVRSPPSRAIYLFHLSFPFFLLKQTDAVGTARSQTAVSTTQRRNGATAETHSFDRIPRLHLRCRNSTSSFQPHQPWPCLLSGKARLKFTGRAAQKMHRWLNCRFRANSSDVPSGYLIGERFLPLTRLSSPCFFPFSSLFTLLGANLLNQGE